MSPHTNEALNFRDLSISLVLCFCSCCITSSRNPASLIVIDVSKKDKVALRRDCAAIDHSTDVLPVTLAIGIDAKAAANYR